MKTYRIIATGVHHNHNVVVTENFVVEATKEGFAAHFFTRDNPGWTIIDIFRSANH